MRPLAHLRFLLPLFLFALLGAPLDAAARPVRDPDSPSLRVPSAHHFHTQARRHRRHRRIKRAKRLLHRRLHHR